MAHFSQLDENNIVIAVNVIGDEDCLDSDGNESEEVGIAFCKSLWGDDTIWKQTSYNTSRGERLSDDRQTIITSESAPAFRVNYGSTGMLYNPTRDAFEEQQPYPSWILNVGWGIYEAPIPYPLDEDGDGIPGFMWDEAVHQADNTTGWVIDPNYIE